MADEQYRWLDSDAAERLLRGEPLDAVDDVARAHAARIAETLSELAAPPLPTSDELPGEASAVAAFRAARTAATVSARASGGRPRALRGPVRRRRTGASRTAGRGRAAGPAMAPRALRAGRGGGRRDDRRGRGGGRNRSAAHAVPRTASRRVRVGGRDPADAGAHAHARGTQTRVHLTDAHGHERRARAGHFVTGRGGRRCRRDRAAAFFRQRRRGAGGEWWIGVRSSCRAVADGRELGTRRMRSLEDAAGGSGRVKTFCKGVLGGGSGRDGDIRGPGRDGDGLGHHGDGDQGDDHDGDGEGHIGPDIGLAPFPPATPHVPAPADATPSPSPTHSAPATEAAH